MINDELLKEVDLKKLIDEEKRARLDNETTKGAHLCVEIVYYLKIILVKICIQQA